MKKKKKAKHHKRKPAQIVEKRSKTSGLKHVAFMSVLFYIGLVMCLSYVNPDLFAASAEQPAFIGSVTFIFGFLPILILVYYFLPWAFKNTTLLIANLLFYTWGEPVYAVLLLLMIWFNFLCGKELEENRDKPWEAEKIIGYAICVNLLVLGFCRYANLVVEGLNAFLPLELEFPLAEAPLGIAVYTLLSIGYLLDVFHGKAEAQTSIKNFALYISMFPQLSAGLVSRYQDVWEQIRHRNSNTARFGDGAMHFIRGFAKVMILANVLGRIPDQIQTTGIGNFTVMTAWVGCVMYAFEIYYTLSGYADMAIGLGKIFGFEFKKNFEYPYTAQSVTEFTGKWYLTLVSWFREYVYIPLGGSKTKDKFIQNTLIVWALIGFWYGASWKFLVWGLYIAGHLILERLVLNKYLVRIPAVFRHVYTLIMILIGWVFFFSPNLTYAFRYLGTMIGIGASGFADAQTLSFIMSNWLLIVLAVLGCTTWGFGILQRLMYNMRTQRIKGIVAGVVYVLLFLVSTAFLVM